MNKLLQPGNWLKTLAFTVIFLLISFASLEVQQQSYFYNINFQLLQDVEAREEGKRHAGQRREHRREQRSERRKGHHRRKHDRHNRHHHDRSRRHHRGHDVHRHYDRPRHRHYRKPHRNHYYRDRHHRHEYRQPLRPYRSRPYRGYRDHYPSYRWNSTDAAIAGAVIGLAIGSIVATLPDNCFNVITRGISYHNCRGTYYRPYYENNAIIYEVVSDPTP
ncbi:hypothetical protein [Candidatus Venteria ishoeyi]|uniref:Uncharacterized protein n=1 Tax=Candidatus Venteria ishoeyi TaxID=1899563 RepID=A0A1H6FAV1_9GAMM|nr:hypothetical protein [Candidatus Venteria ishoeyi]MDM8545992.1 hypothetical protein [Candidatus Venteria ishoeyi]SEH06763.1 Uncharacterised protein [Candidatus Venteria ishoeyi]